MFLTKEGLSGPLQLEAAASTEGESGEPEEPASSDPADHPTNLYRFPALYDALKTPSAQDVAVVRTLMYKALGAGPYSILDPAAGPGNWLRPFCDGSNQLVGNDYCEPMVRYVESTLGPCGCVARHGDMYDLRIEQTFDVVLEVSGVTSILPDVSSLTRILDHWADRLNPRGLLLLLVNLREEVPAVLPHTTWEQQGRLLPTGGTSGVRYELMEDRPEQGTQLIRRTVTTEGAPGFPSFLQETYALRVWTPQEVQQALAASSSARLEALAHPDDADNLNPGWFGERYLVLRRT